MLLILHKRRDNQAVLDEWNRLVASPGTDVPGQAEEEGEDEVGLVGRGGQETRRPAARRVRRPAPAHRHCFRGFGVEYDHTRRPSVPAVASERDHATTKEVSRSIPLTALARSYVVVALRLEELPALSHQLGIAPYAAPDRGSPLFVIARSDARQLSAVTTWNKSDQLAYAMAQGIVQEAKEHERTPEQLRELLAVVDPVDAELGDQVRKLLRGPANAGSHRAGQVGGPPKKA